MTHKPAIRMTWLVLITAGVAVLTVGAGGRLLAHWSYAVESGRIQANADGLVDGDELADLQRISNAFRMVAKVARPGVVHIRVRAGERSDAEVQEYEQWLREHLGDALDERALRQRLRRFRNMPGGSGSGFLIDNEGHIVTNNHVVGERNRLSVTLSDNREYDAIVVGKDPKTDVALIKIEAPDLHPLKLGDSDRMDVGDWVLAVGAPFGLSQTVTHGIISATGRTSIPGVKIRYQNFLQTDAAVNPGNSGGPLMNLRGEVIGVNTAIATLGEAFNSGVAFVIPSNMVRKVADELKQHGEVARGWLGISMAELTREDRKIFGVDGDAGILVDAVLADTPAEKAGLTVEDVIVRVDGKPARDMPQLRAQIADVKPGQEAVFEVVRDRRLQKLRIRMARLPDNPQGFGPGTVTDRELEQLELTLRTLRPTIAPRLGFDRTERGVLVISATARAIQRLGLDPRDDELIAAGDDQPVASFYELAQAELIVACNNQPVASFYELAQAMSAAHSGEIELEVKNAAGEVRTIVVSSPQ